VPDKEGIEKNGLKNPGLKKALSYLSLKSKRILQNEFFRYIRRKIGRKPEAILYVSKTTIRTNHCLPLNLAFCSIHALFRRYTAETIL